MPKKRPLSDGFTSMLGSLASSHQGYQRLDPEEDPPLTPVGGGQVKDSTITFIESMQNTLILYSAKIQVESLQNKLVSLFLSI